MKKLIAASVTAVALIAAAPASADPGPNDGCGDLFSQLGAPGFGQAVSEVAQQGGFNDYVRLVCRGF